MLQKEVVHKYILAMQRTKMSQNVQCTPNSISLLLLILPKKWMTQFCQITWLEKIFDIFLYFLLWEKQRDHIVWEWALSMLISLQEKTIQHEMFELPKIWKICLKKVIFIAIFYYFYPIVCIYRQHPMKQTKSPLDRAPPPIIWMACCYYWRK